MSNSEMTYKQFLEFLANAYAEYAKDEESDTAFMCVVLEDGPPVSHDEICIRENFKKLSGVSLVCHRLSEYRMTLRDFIKINKKQYCGASFTAYNLEKMEEVLEVQNENSNKLRSMLLYKWASEITVLE